ncbi:hypothetical protein SPW_4305 [Streptomyces sp. W007]|nr:hypothetical protein SPW_4305 [Streptomyces sp. W007]
MSVTQIDVDDEALERAMALSGARNAPDLGEHSVHDIA